jgi:hypothetical protein
MTTDCFICGGPCKGRLRGNAPRVRLRSAMEKHLKLMLYILAGFAIYDIINLIIAKAFN